LLVFKSPPSPARNQKAHKTEKVNTRRTLELKKEKRGGVNVPIPRFHFFFAEAFFFAAFFLATDITSDFMYDNNLYLRFIKASVPYCASLIEI
jgi:hypothetical protein